MTNLQSQGCGRGYDVIMLALHGFDAYGLEISATGVSTAKKYAASEMQRPQEYNFGLGWTGPVTPGNASFVEGNFFKPGWERQISANGDIKFDLVYDYTVTASQKSLLGNNCQDETDEGSSSVLCTRKCVRSGQRA